MQQTKLKVLQVLCCDALSFSKSICHLASGPHTRTLTHTRVVASADIKQLQVGTKAEQENSSRKIAIFITQNEKSSLVVPLLPNSPFHAPSQRRRVFTHNKKSSSCLPNDDYQICTKRLLIKLT